MSNKGLILFLLRAITLSVGLAFVSLSLYFFYGMLAFTPGTAPSDFLAEFTEGNQLLYAALLVQGFALLYLCLRPQPRVMDLFPDDQLITLPDLEEGATAGAMEMGEADSRETLPLRELERLPGDAASGRIR